MADRDVSPEALAKGHEGSDIATSWVFVAAILFVLTVAAFALVPLLFVGPVRQGDAYSGRHATDLRRDLLRPGPALESDPQAALAAFQTREKARIQNYAWVDRNTGVARIPVSRAMEILAAQGWPTPPGPERGK